MSSRVTLLLLAGFWLIMNFLLWRFEYRPQASGGDPVPVELVWHKIITAPDNSSLEILHHGQRAGLCRWLADPISLPAAGKTAEEAPPDSLAGRVAGFRLALEGNLALPDFTNRVVFSGDLRLTPNSDWEEFNVRLNVQRSQLAVHSRAADRQLQLFADSEGEKLERSVSFAELQNPAALARALEVPLPPELAGLLELTGGPGGHPAALPGVKWEAATDRMAIGHATVRVYRLRAIWLGKVQAVITLSPVGEILRVELPDEWLLVNDQLNES